MTDQTPEESEDDALYRELFGGPGPFIQTATGPVEIAALRGGATPQDDTDPDDQLYAALFGDN